MLLTEITLGSKAHHDLVAQMRSKVMTRGAFLRMITNSTMSSQDVADITDAMTGIDMNKPVTRDDLEQISAIADVSLDELLLLANID